jgi:DNA-binding winged helix-turn-helix (wHTH) protein
MDGTSGSVVLRFGGCAFDGARGVLTDSAGNATALRPKTADLAALLLRRPRRLVTRAEILDAVWPGLFVTDDSITQCVGELRRAMGAEGPALLRTVPRRGYILEADVTAAGALPDTASPAGAAPAGGTPGFEVPPAALSPAADAPQAAPSPHADAAQPEPAARPEAPPARPPLWVLAAGGGAALAVALLWLGSLWAQWPQTSPPPAAPAPPALAAAPAPDAPSPAEQARALVEEGRQVMRGTGPVQQRRLAARALFERALALDPANVRAMAEAGFTYTNAINAGDSLNPAADLAAAAALSERLEATAPGTSSALNLRAAVLRLQRRHGEALEFYARVAAQDPSAHAARANVGFMLLMIGRGEEGSGPILASLAAEPSLLFAGTWNTYLGLIELHTQAGDHGVARLRQGLEHDAFMTRPERLAYLLAALWESGQHEAARALAAELRQRHPSVTLSWFRTRALSEHPVYQAQFSRLASSLAASGLPE